MNREERIKYIASYYEWLYKMLKNYSFRFMASIQTSVLKWKNIHALSTQKEFEQIDENEL